MANARRGPLAIESTRLELAQDAAPCTFHLDNTRVDVDAGAADARIGVTAMSGCAWSQVNAQRIDLTPKD